jgi:putative nucleotidyltransferase with HDIG domain
MEKQKHSILFVDDDVFVLKGFRRSLTEYEDVWNADFATSGRDALSKLASAHFDAVITDMHMPGMDGIQLLDEVSRNMPGVMRFVLSGNASEDQVLRSTPLVHQMIPKPCDLDHLYSIVERACRLGDKLKDPQLHHIITGIKNLPSVPLLYKRLIKELQSETASSMTVGNIIAQDTAMTAKILQLVNSAFFGVGDNVSSPQRAVSILGLNTVKALVLGIQVFSEYQGSSKLPISIDALWKHSILVSNLAYKISRSLKLSSTDQENARVSGILHDIGKLMLFKIPGFFQTVLPDKNGEISVSTEYQALGTSHSEMGAYLLGIWGLPNQIVEAITFHHRPGEQIFEKADLMTALYVANGLTRMWKFEKKLDYKAYFDLNYLQKAGVYGQLDEWATMAKELIYHDN